MLIIEKIVNLIHVGKEIEKDLIIVSAHYNDVGSDISRLADVF